MNTARLESIASVVLTGAALVVALSVVSDFVTGRKLQTAEATQLSPNAALFVKELEFEPSIGRRRGSSQAPVRIVEFFDLECPACRRYDQMVLSKVLAALGEKASLTLVHFPLSIHRFAPSAARASECALREGRFHEFVSVAYASQDSFGLKPWTRMAAEAGVVDTALFTRCTSDPTTASAVDSGSAMATRLKLTGTPAISINGWVFTRPPTERELLTAAKKVLEGVDPYARTSAAPN